VSACLRRATARDAAAIARVHVDSWRATYRGIVSDVHLRSLTYQTREERWRALLAGGSLPFVAEVEGVVCGFADGGDSRDPQLADGELYALYRAPTVQRRGLGRALVGALADDLRRDGHSSLLAWALRDNPACGFYARLGGEARTQKPIVIGGQELIEVAFVWPRIADVAAAAP